ncbi:MAG: cation:proton antiporter [Acidobacteria bacterium]|nr:cation:proton antiporter [Acidobacteriota bacterium]
MGTQIETPSPLDGLSLDTGSFGSGMPFGLSPEVAYIALLFALIVMPRVLVRWKIPPAITSLLLGAAIALSTGWFQSDATVQLLATLGISALFLFAGLEVDVQELARKRRVLVQHLALRIVATVVLAWAITYLVGLEWRPAVLVVLALLTPSAGFILDSLSSLPLEDDQRQWVRSKTIATELVSLVVLFVVLQSGTWSQLLAGSAALLALILTLPLMFRAFASWIAPYAPKSDFAFLLMLTLLSAFATRKLGAYYLVGAFVVGMVAQRFRERLPSMASEHTLHAVEVFASFFVPFYFFNAGLHLRADNFSPLALGFGVGAVLTIVPLRIALVAVHRRLALGEPLASGARVGVSLVPTLVFTLVIAELLRDVFGVDAALFGGLVVYTLANTLVPTLVLRVPPPLYDQPGLPVRADLPQIAYAVTGATVGPVAEVVVDNHGARARLAGTGAGAVAGTGDRALREGELRDRTV